MRSRRLSIVLGAVLVPLVPVAAVLVSARPAGATDLAYYVSPTGSDTNAGTQAAPFQHLSYAQSVVQGQVATASGNIIVNLESGTYSLTSPLQFGSADSGRDSSHQVIWQADTGAQPVLDGGYDIAAGSWTQVGTSGVWKASVPTNMSRQLYVTTDPANLFRATLVHKGSGLTSPSWQPLLGGDYGSSDAQFMQGWTHNPTSIEFVYDSTTYTSVDQAKSIPPSGAPWVEQRCGVDHITSSAIYMNATCWDISQDETAAYPQQGLGYPTDIVNAYELLTSSRPGEFYLDNSTTPNFTLYYSPRSVDNMSTLTAVLPTASSLLQVSNAHNLTFEGLTFQNTTWTAPSTEHGFMEQQANLRATSAYPVHHGSGYSPGAWPTPDAAVSISNTSVVAGSVGVTFKNNVLQHLGGAGLGLDNNLATLTTPASGTLVQGNIISDVASNGIDIGDAMHAETPSSQYETVTDNVVENVGQDYHGAVGIWAGYTQYLTISHNVVTGVPYTGISIGWGWSVHLTDSAGGNVILDNLVTNATTQRSDGGGIYVLDTQPGLLIRGNLIHDLSNAQGAIYLDQEAGSWTNTYQPSGATGPLRIQANAMYNIQNITNPYDTGPADIWMHACLNHDSTDSARSIDIEYNYWPFPVSAQPPAGTTYFSGGACDVRSQANTALPDNPPSAPIASILPASIIANAGLESAYAANYPLPPPSETIPPTTPGTPSDLGRTTACQDDLSWTESTDDVGVTAYEIDTTDSVGTLPLAVALGTTELVKPGLGVLTDPINVSIAARDAAGNLSTSSPTLSIGASTDATCHPTPVNTFMDGTTVTAYNNLDGVTGTATNMTDGNLNTSTQANGHIQWQSTIDLGMSVPLSEVEVDQTYVHSTLCSSDDSLQNSTGANGEWATDWQIDLSTDGSTYTPKVAYRNGVVCAGGDVVPLPSGTSARYVRIVADKPTQSGQRGVEMTLSEVYAS